MLFTPAAPIDERELFARCLGLFLPGELPIVIFDEFDKVTDHNIRELMANTIKGLADNSSRSTVIIVGVADDVASLVGEHASVRRHLAQVRIQRMSLDEQIVILDKRIPRLGMTIANNAKWRIVALSRGLPAYVHQLGRFAALAAISEKKLAITNICAVHTQTIEGFCDPGVKARLSSSKAIAARMLSGQGLR
jgi:hypothetical protein